MLHEPVIHWSLVGAKWEADHVMLSGFLSPPKPQWGDRKQGWICYVHFLQHVKIIP